MRAKAAARKTDSKKGNGKKAASGNGNSAAKKQQMKPVKKGPAKAEKNKPVEKDWRSGIKKQYLKSGEVCNVTFSLPKEAAPEARVVTVVGDFNDWNASSGIPMKKMKSGDYKVTMKLPRGKEYRFKYLIDSSRWENDWDADEYVPNAFGCDDSLVKI